MSKLENKRILLGITGSIAAYKSAFLARELMREGATVRVVMTPAATEFVSSLTFSTLTGNEALDSLRTNREWSNHVKWGRWADVFIVAPLTAQTMNKMAHGAADNMLTACYLSSEAPVFVAPAMDVDMWLHPATQRNMDQLQEDGCHLLHPDSGALASGLEGPGRMMEPAQIIKILNEHLDKDKLDFAGKSLLITAGPTREYLDPIRFLTNAASGKTGIALAEEASRRGANVSLILGPTDRNTRDKNIQVHRVSTADEMYQKAESLFSDQDIAIFSAAVSDYKPATQADQKMKKSGDEINLKLKQNPDIAKTLGQQKNSNQFIVGFALETQDAEDHARQKLREKNFDMIVLNRAGESGTGIGSEQNRVRFLFPDNKSQYFELKSKREIASDLLNAIAQRINP